MYKIGNATVRIHGEVNQENLHNALERFIKQVELKKEKDNGKGKHS
jgi:hypothetical protein